MAKKIHSTLFLLFSLFNYISVSAQTVETEEHYLIHTSGNHLGKSSSGGGILISSADSNPQKLKFIPSSDGYYVIQSSDGIGFLSLSGSWNTVFSSDSTQDEAKYAIEKVSTNLIKLKCKANSKYLGTDNTTASSSVYSDKSGDDSRHYWYLGDNPDDEMATDTLTYIINPEATRQDFEGWGVSLCWWANMCGKWSDEKIEEIVDWLVSPEGLNYNIFRYNIGGGDDPENKNCDEHHMGSGKGLRAEMEGFKDSLNGEYLWNRDEAQRKIMLKIKEKRPDAIFEAFSNSCPYYMTYSGCCAGNTDSNEDNLKPEYYEDFANYLVDVCKYYKDTYGIEFKTLEPFNEPQSDYWGANGGQEGCHFDISSQIDFVKVLYPILESSGLNTIIAASDETNVAHTVNAFKAYQEAGIMDMVGQWNTHTYTATNKSRSQLSALCNDADKTLWMSEVGMGGSGISGNITMAQKLIDDVRYLVPSAWADWQYIEENTDQWCLVRGDFDEQTYEKVKNYYIRQQFSKFIKKGYTFLTVTNGQTLVAKSADGDTLVVVTLNNNSMKTAYDMDLSFFNSISESDITAYITNETEDLSSTTEFELVDNHIIYTMPGYSVTTFVIKVEETEDADNSIVDGKAYLVLPRAANNLVLDSSDGDITIRTFQSKDSQVWILKEKGDGYTFTNNLGQILTSDASNYNMSVSEEEQEGQTFLISAIDYPFCKILEEDGERGFDLSGESYSEGTTVGLWSYGTSVDAFNRQWQFFRLPDGVYDDVTPVISADENIQGKVMTVKCQNNSIANVSIDSKSPGVISVYSVNGSCLYRNKTGASSLSIPLQKGYYIIGYKSETAKDKQIIVIE